MSDKLKVGQKVELTEKKLKGKIAYIGTTAFSAGKWIGVILEEPKGKNNGTVQGRTYFNCDENCGIFVRQTQIRVLDDEGFSGIRPPSTPSSGGSNTSLSGISQTPASTPTSTPMTLISTTQLKIPSRPSTGNTLAGSQSVPALQQQEQILTIPSKPLEDFKAIKAELKDLQEKFDTLRLKRAEDKAKLKEFEKTKIQLQQLQEYKKQITESQADLQKQLNLARKEAKEAIEEKLKHAEEMRDLAETAEIATLDKEMAEEKYEQLLRDHELTKEKLEEVTLDLELLKSEIEEKGNDGAVSSYQVKQLEQQNERLKEAIIRLRDLSAQDKIEMLKLNKELDKYKNECLDLHKLSEKQSVEITQLESQITELKEQIDDALGAQEMVEILTEKNLELEDKNSKLQEEISDLENLHDINEQLNENARETELELREELDMMRSKLIATVRKVEDLQETLADYEKTIQKFRDLVSSLRQENQELKQQTDSNASVTQQQQQQQAENIEFKIRFAEAKAFSRAIEMDLRRLEVIQALEHIRYLSQFMPESFFIRGGDHDAIQVLLFIPRMVQKCDIIMRQMLEKYPLDIDLPVKITHEMVIKGNEVVLQQAFLRRLLFLSTSIQTVLNQYADALKCCSLDLYLKIASLLPELLVHEKTIDNYIELLKKDQFDETVSLDYMEKALNYFSSLYNLHLADGKVNDCCALLDYVVKQMKAGVEVSHLDCVLIRCCIAPEAPQLKILENVLVYLDDIQQFCKKIKRRLAGDARYKLTHSMENEIRDCVAQINRVAIALNSLRINVIDHCKEDKAENQEQFLYIDGTTLENVASNIGGFKFIADSLSGIMGICSQLCTGLQQGAFDEDPTSQHSSREETKDPLETRAQYIKAQSGQLNEIKVKLEAKESEVNDLKRVLKLKVESCSEMQIRRDIAEKKLHTVTKESEERLAKLENELDELKAIHKRKEKEFEETLNHLQSDIETVESEKAELKEKVKLLSKRTIFEGLSKSPITAASQGPSIGSENSYSQQITSLQSALHKVCDENYDLRMKIAESDLNFKPQIKISSHKPAWLIRAQGNADMNEAYIKQNQLAKKLQCLQKEAKELILKDRLYDMQKPLKNQVLDDIMKRKCFEAKYNETVAEVVNFIANYNEGDYVKAKFTSFKAPEYHDVLKGKPRVTAKIKVPCIGKVEPSTVNVGVTLKQLQHLHNHLL